ACAALGSGLPAGGIGCGTLFTDRNIYSAVSNNLFNNTFTPEKKIIEIEEKCGLLVMTEIILPKANRCT
ncbi:MAG: hypothetical protein M3162_08445, partial [Thermoproteota archaeon]|nr:hypothetical protein [Thermoproteota archaeon]